MRAAEPRSLPLTESSHDFLVVEEKRSPRWHSRQRRINPLDPLPLEMALSRIPSQSTNPKFRRLTSMCLCFLRPTRNTASQLVTSSLGDGPRAVLGVDSSYHQDPVSGSFCPSPALAIGPGDGGVESRTTPFPNWSPRQRDGCCLKNSFFTCSFRAHSRDDRPARVPLAHQESRSAEHQLPSSRLPSNAPKCPMDCTWSLAPALWRRMSVHYINKLSFALSLPARHSRRVPRWA